MRSETPPPVDRTTIISRLDTVCDPELDRSIVELEYIHDIHVDGGHVAVAFVLPTAWCSPPFAWMMATGIRDEVRSIDGVTDVQVELLDHMHDDQINHGVNQEMAFQEAFEDAEDGIEEVRRTLDRKARLARQYRAVKALLDVGLDPHQITDLTESDIEEIDDRIGIYLRDRAVCVTVPAEPITAYLEKARATDVVTVPTDPLFVDLDGTPIAPEDFERVHRRTRLANSNISGQAGLCAQLHEARNGVEVDVPGDRRCLEDVWAPDVSHSVGAWSPRWIRDACLSSTSSGKTPRHWAYPASVLSTSVTRELQL